MVQHDLFLEISELLECPATRGYVREYMWQVPVHAPVLQVA